MGKIFLGVNMEFVRHHDKPFAWGVAKAAEIGYEYIEPMVHLGRELLSEARYFHSVSMYDDPRWVKDLCDKNKIKLSGLSSHTPLCKPEISVEYLKQAIRWASDAGAPVVNTDEGPKARVDHQRDGLYPDDLHTQGSFHGCRTIWHQDRFGTPPAVQQVSQRSG